METKLVFKPGIQLELTPLANKGGWSDGNLVRWKFGQVERRCKTLSMLLLCFVQYSQAEDEKH